ncbi:MAG: MaoC family dehydratase [Alphaproteobacteria bacterium]
MTGRYLEDFSPGERFTSARLTVSEADILDYAHKYDPQPFHADKEKAKDGLFGDIVASGFQTCALTFKLFYETGVISACNMGAPAVDEVRFLKPLRPGDTLHVEVEVLEARPSATKPGRGILKLLYRTFNQRGEMMASLVIPHIVRCRPA